MRAVFLPFLTLVFLSASCSGGGVSRSRSKAAGSADSLELVVPQTPVSIADSGERLKYSFSHYWDNLSPSVRLHSLEEYFICWLKLVDAVSLEEACSSLLSAYGKDPSRLAALAEKYLYDPQSPFRTEDVYRVIAEKEGQEDVARLCALNAVGSPAADFITEDRKGRHSSLYRVDAGYTILFFSNPYCKSCRNVVNVLTGDEMVKRLSASGELAVMAVYIDEDLEQWRSGIAAYPESWITVYDPTFTLRNNEKYNIRAIPSLYLLDREKKVLLKDASLKRLIEYIWRITDVS